MESAFHFCCSPQSTTSLIRIPSSMITQRNPVLGFRYNASSQSHSGSYKLRHDPYHVYYRTPHAVDRSLGPEMDEKGDDRMVAKHSVRASVVLACALSIIGWSSNVMKPMAIAGPKQLYQKAPPAMYSTILFPIGGKAALKSLLDVSACLASDQNVFPRGFNLDQLPSSPSKEDVDVIKVFISANSDLYCLFQLLLRVFFLLII